MANFDSTNLLPRHVSDNDLKLKSDTSKVQRTASSIVFIFNFFLSLVNEMLRSTIVYKKTDE